MVYWPTTSRKEYSGYWTENVIRNCVINTTQGNIDKPGKHTVKIYCADPGVIIQKIVIDLGGMKKSYLGPDITKVN